MHLKSSSPTVVRPLGTSVHSPQLSLWPLSSRLDPSARKRQQCRKIKMFSTVGATLSPVSHTHSFNKSLIKDLLCTRCSEHWFLRESNLR